MGLLASSATSLQVQVTRVPYCAVVRIVRLGHTSASRQASTDISLGRHVLQKRDPRVCKVATHLSSLTAASCLIAGRLASVARIFASLAAASAPLMGFASSSPSALPGLCPALTSAEAKLPACAPCAPSMCSMHSASLRQEREGPLRGDEMK